MVKTLLEQLEEHINVDCDNLDPVFIKSLPIKCHDQTSNQRIVHDAIVAPENAHILEATVKDFKGQPWDDIYVNTLARIAATVAPVISGTLLSQTSPSRAYDKEYILFDARRRHKAYMAAGIPADRIAIKIATTTAGVQAAKILSGEGIKTLGTALFSVPQALAASQAGMFAISLYYNEPNAHTDAAIWPDVADPANEHPMSARHLLIRRAYGILKERTGKEQPQMKTASYASPREVMTAAALGADHVTIGRPLLEDLAFSDKMPKYQKGFWKVPVSEQAKGAGIAWEDWTPPVPNETADRIAKVLAQTDASQLHSLDEDYLADGVVDRYNNEDEMTRTKLEEGLKRFSFWENETKKHIEEVQAKFA
ncbi:putative transaldolase [Thozetella sp. PMI_491]|nr:putative transaldolase [Thozetella sp. PMI_491]